MQKHASLNPDGFIDQPIINTSDMDLQRISEEAWAELKYQNNPPRIFNLGTKNIWILEGEDGELLVKVLDHDLFRHFLARVVGWTNKNKRKAPPSEVVTDMLANPDPPLPKLSRVVRHPVFTKDYALHEFPGYNSASQAYYHAGWGLLHTDVPKTPTKEDVELARGLIEDDLLIDFPFVSESDKTHAMAFLLLPFVRDLIQGPTPLHLFEAPKPGTGKTLLVEVMGYVILGKALPTMTESKDEEEWRRRITATLIEAPELILFDNVTTEMRSGALASAITSTLWTDRYLGKSMNITLPISCVWAMTGNNPKLSDEFVRRRISIELDSRMENPWLRDQHAFKHPNLREWVRNNRRRLIWACLVLIQNWVTQGHPDAGGEIPRLGSFEDWSRVIGGILESAGIGGFLGNLGSLYQKSQQSKEGALTNLFSHWWEKYGEVKVGVSELYRLIKDRSINLDLGANKDEIAEKTKLGKFLSQWKERQVGEFIIHQENRKQGAQQYRLIVVKKGYEKEVQ